MSNSINNIHELPEQSKWLSLMDNDQFMKIRQIKNKFIYDYNWYQYYFYLLVSMCYIIKLHKKESLIHIDCSSDIKKFLRSKDMSMPK